MLQMDLKCYKGEKNQHILCIVWKNWWFSSPFFTRGLCQAGEKWRNIFFVKVVELKKHFTVDKERFFSTLTSLAQTTSEKRTRKTAVLLHLKGWKYCKWRLLILIFSQMHACCRKPLFRYSISDFVWNFYPENAVLHCLCWNTHVKVHYFNIDFVRNGIFR